MTLQRPGLLVLLATLLALIPTSSANGQLTSPTGAGVKLLSGQVTGADGKPVAGAAVKLEDEGTHQVTSRLTDANGHYEFRRLPGTADYRVWASFHRHNSSDHRIDHLDDKPHPVIDIVVTS